MDSIDFNTHDKFKKFPPLYTEQVNNTTLSKQLDIWHKIINDEVLNNNHLFILGIQSVDFYPFKNFDISRNVNVSFLALILEYLVNKQYGFYLHPIMTFCQKNNVTVWGALFYNKKFTGSNLVYLHDEFTNSLLSSPRNSSRDKEGVDLLKKRRDALMKFTYSFGVFPYPLSEMTNLVLNCINAQCTNKEIETVYYIFYNKKECNKDFNKFPEEHLAFLLSHLAYNNKISLSYNESIPPNSLNNKNVGIQLL